jgi:CheY-like chemotaxis protein
VGSCTTGDSGRETLADLLAHVEAQDVARVEHAFRTAKGGLEIAFRWRDATGARFRGERQAVPFRRVVGVLLEETRSHPQLARANGVRWRGPTPPRLAGLRILVVHDDRDALERTSRLLRDARATVETAKTVEGALARIESGALSLVVSDVRMRGRDGSGLVEALRARERATGRERLRAACVTGPEDATDRARALRAGYDLYLPEPVAPDVLVDELARLSEGARREVPVRGIAYGRAGHALRNGGG